MAAAENGALPGGKVGGVGDVVRDLPPALAELGWRTSVLVPEYGIFRDAPDAAPVTTLEVPFGGELRTVTVLEIPGDDPRVRHIAFQHPWFAPQGPKIYCDDGPERPFASDATKFALFSAAAASYVLQLDPAPDIVHLHDWHAALYCVLREFDSHYAALQRIRTVYTIHNLALQGIRPLDHDASSFKAWYPSLQFDRPSVADPRFSDCVNPMAAAIRLADSVNTVSPTYATEILLPNDPATGFRGGEGLEHVLEQACADGRLVGILNGCPYPSRRDRRRPSWRRLLATIEREVHDWQEKQQGSTEIHRRTLERLAAMPRQRPRHLLTSIGRLTDQKAALFLEQTASGVAALDAILDELATEGVCILLGSGDAALERAVAEIAGRNDNLLFLCGYSETFADLMYQAGDLFLMPSSFEPCGISQMLAMRASQACVVHAVGGLTDTVRNDINGFTFDGRSPTAQADNFVKTVRHALTTKTHDADRWLKIRDCAASERFSWATSAERYVEALYERTPTGLCKMISA